MYFIGLDIGTTGCKAAVFDEAGACFGRCYEEFDIICRAPGWAEQSPAVMWEAVTHVLKESVAQAKAAGMRAEEVRALSTSVLGEEVMPVDGDYRPLRDAILGMDYRADEETKLLTGAVPAQRIYDITGFPPHPMGSLPTILWMRRHEPELIPRTYKYVTFTEYVMKRLGAGEGVVDHPQAGRTMAFDIERKCWSDELLRAAGLDRSLFCETGGNPAGSSGTCRGRPRPSWASPRRWRWWRADRTRPAPRWAPGSSMRASAWIPTAPSRASA